MVSKIIIALSAMLAVAVAIAPGGAGAALGGWGANAGGWGVNTGVAWGPNAAVNPWIPPWISAAPWYPQWGACTTIGSSCVDCNTKIVCTKIGGLQRACTDPTLPYCNLGECSATPTAECTPAVPATTA